MDIKSFLYNTLSQNSIGVTVHEDRICVSWLKGSIHGLSFSGGGVFGREPDGKSDSLNFLDGILSDFIQKHAIKSFDLYLGLPDDGCLIKTIALPVSVKDEIGAVLQYEIEKYIPMPASEVEFGYRVISQEKASESIQLLLQVIKKDRLKPFIGLKDFISGGLTGIMLTSSAVNEYQDFLESGGKMAANSNDYLSDMEDPCVIGAAALAFQKFNLQKDRINFLPERFRKKPSRIPLMVFLVLLSLNLIALMVMGASYFIQHRIQNNQLDEKLVLLKQQVLKTETLAQRIQFLEQNVSEISQVVTSRPSMLDILNELSTITPMDTHLTEFEFKKNTVWIKGLSINASRLLRIYEASDLFSNVGFESKIEIRDGRQETFVIKMTYGGKNEK
ncbi:PilN domain-containing protein [uncultured Desulfobacter sp.]|uniref:PilN domain-containing protein n=1 Tax=uncultured Desulfobacter sp. TaxID=240139 RepID=UPI002AAB5E16|nr:PilN domain-containing protein [uncultured Desulfobacter sp.]